LWFVLFQNRKDVKRMAKQANYNIIRYANCWEDADLLMQLVKHTAPKAVLSIASAGDNSFALLCSGAKVVAVDISEPQLFLVNLKKCAFKALNYRKFSEFLGFTPSTKRWAIFTEKIREMLPRNEQMFWEEKKQII
jgi:S-adenosylmethionine-diacylglycerol 3-amino-3-carboxypropyl transferase